MSHTVHIDIQFRDRQCLISACQRLGLRMQEGSHKLFQTTEEGIGVSLLGWRYPAVIKPDGTVAIDNYNGSWGKIEELNKLKAYYGVEVATMAAYMQGYGVIESFNEETQEIELRISV